MAKRRALGRALTGFSQNFLPAWQSMQYMDRLNEREERMRRRDARSDYMTEGQRLASQFGTASDVDAALAELQLLHKGVFSDEEGRASLERHLKTEDERMSEVARRAGEDFPFLGDDQIERIMTDVGLDTRRLKTLPSAPFELSELQSDIPGALLETGLTPSDAQGKDLPFLAGSWGETQPPTWEEGGVAGPLGEQVDALREESRSALEGRAAFQRGLDEKSRLSLLGVDEQFAADHYDAQIEREIERLNALAPHMREIALEDLRSELTERQRISRDREQLAFDVARHKKLATINAMMSDRPQFMPHIDPETQEVTTTMMFRGPDGFWKLQNMSGVFPGVPLTSAATASMFDPTAKLLQEALAHGVDLTDPKKRELLVEEAVRRNIDPDIAAGQINATARMAAIGSGDGPPRRKPPIPPDVAEGNVSQFGLGESPGAGVISGMPLTVPSMEDLGRPGTETTVTPAIPFETYEGTLGPDRNAPIGQRERPWWQSSSPRNIQGFLGERNPLTGETVLDWLTSQTQLDPRISQDMIQDMLRHPDGYRLLVKAWNDMLPEGP